MVGTSSDLRKRLEKCYFHIPELAKTIKEDFKEGVENELQTLLLDTLDSNVEQNSPKNLTTKLCKNLKEDFCKIFSKNLLKTINIQRNWALIEIERPLQSHSNCVLL
ncbi:unnamed protein product [Moneuplotes crassus]|uniref:Uncharacterized protein n=1 Tax=Euplotes crassus TaxID=5936 RepID=A0AAD2D392_EUPCR|nr:unnamed protein product [Moneuplotes crassus]